MKIKAPNTLKIMLYIIILFVFLVWFIVKKYVVIVVPIFAPSINDKPCCNVIEELEYKIEADKIMVDDEFISAVIKVPSTNVRILEDENSIFILFFR